MLLHRADAWTLPVAVARATQVAAAVGIVLMVVAGTALGRGLTAAPLPNSHAALRTDGLYRFVRHPIYTGLLLAVALTLTSGSRWALSACVALGRADQRESPLGGTTPRAAAPGVPRIRRPNPTLHPPADPPRTSTQPGSVLRTDSCQQMYAKGSSTTTAIAAASTTSEPVAALRTSNQASMTSIVAATAA